MKRVLALDVGGSGVKHARVELHDGRARLASEPGLFERPDFARFAPWLAERLRERPELLAVACCGLVDAETGVNHACTLAGWRDYPLRAELERAFPGTRVVVLNDIEAHLWAHAHDYAAPVMTVAVGTSVGIAIADEHRRILRTRRGWPLEFGNVRLRTSASKDALWFALGTPGLEELQDREQSSERGAEHFGWRLGAMLVQYAVAFAVRSVVLSGGAIARWWPAMEGAARAEFAAGLPYWRESDPPELIVSPHGREAALVGVARWAVQPDER